MEGTLSVTSASQHSLVVASGCPSCCRAAHRRVFSSGRHTASSERGSLRRQRSLLLALVFLRFKSNSSPQVTHSSEWGQLGINDICHVFHSSSPHQEELVNASVEAMRQEVAYFA